MSALLISAALLAGCADMPDSAPHAASYVDEEALSSAISGTEASLSGGLLIGDAAGRSEGSSGQIKVPSELSEVSSGQGRVLSGRAEAPSAQTGAASGKTEALPGSGLRAGKVSVAAGGTILWTGKDGDDSVRILFLGDGQYTEGRDTGTEIPSLVAEKVKAPCTVYNLAIRGSTASLDVGTRNMKPEEWNSTSLLGMAHLIKGDVSTDMFLYNYPELTETLRAIDPEKLDYIVIDHGINDYLNSKQIYDDEDGDDPTDFSPAYRMSLQILQEACPKARILCCTPCYSQFYGQDGALLGEGSSLSNSFGNLGDYISGIDYNYRLFERADYIDMFDGTNMDLDVYTVEEYMSDGIHLSARGRGAYAAVIAQLIDKKRGIITKEYQRVTIDDY